jgi:acyl-lipid omega-6 desaturase (Delta-12 desaturase)
LLSLTPPASRLISATKRFAKDDARTSWWHVLSLTLMLTCAFLGTLWNVNLLGRIGCSILAGFLLMRFFVIYHDQQHYAILSASKPAEFLMRIFGILAITPSSVWRSSHNHHHKHNSKLRGSDIGSFPIMTKDEFMKTTRKGRISYLFVRHPLTILFGYVFMFLFGMCINPFIHYPRRHLDCLVAIVVHLAIGIALVMYGGWLALLLTLIVPFLITYAVATYFFYAQHNFPGVSFSDQGGWTYEKAAMESSSFMRTGRLMSWFTANISYHHVHHLNARIPFYRLPEVVRAIPELRDPKTTSLSPVDIMRCLRLKVWDVENQRMVPAPTV